jgi:hypothetical protein
MPAANPAITLWLPSTRPAGRVAELGSLGWMHWWNLSAAKRDLGGGALGSKTLLPYMFAFVALEIAVVVSRRVICAHIQQ